MAVQIARRTTLSMAVALGGAALTGLTAGPARAAGIADVDAFVSRHNGALVDYDGYPTDWPWQCFDLWVFYCREVVGFQNVLSTQYGGHPGYACAIWDGFDYNGSGSYFNKIDAGSAPQKGDVAVWQFGAYNHATSHVAVILEDRGSNVLVFEQNGWPDRHCAVQQTTKSGIAGYLRPKQFVGPVGPPTSPLLNNDTVAFQANTGNMFSVGPNGTKDHQLGMRVGTSPSVAKLTSGINAFAVHANTGGLWTVDGSGTYNRQIGMMAGTSPAITALNDGTYKVALQSNTGSLCTYGSAGGWDYRQGVMAGTSPAIATLANGDTIVAFQANTGSLFTLGPDGTRDWKQGMMAGTSPAITAIGNEYQIAFQANTGSLITYGAAGNKDWQLGMMKDTSPSITTLSDGSFIAAFQANTGDLYTAGPSGIRNWGLGMMNKTSPSVSAWGSAAGFEVAFQANTGSLFTVGSRLDKDWQQGVMAGTSPSGGH